MSGGSSCSESSLTLPGICSALCCGFVKERLTFTCSFLLCGRLPQSLDVVVGLFLLGGLPRRRFFAVEVAAFVFLPFFPTVLISSTESSSSLIRFTARFFLICGSRLALLLRFLPLLFLSASESGTLAESLVSIFRGLPFRFGFLAGFLRLTAAGRDLGEAFNVLRDSEVGTKEWPLDPSPESMCIAACMASISCSSSDSI
mmetsp:Transcript_13979/g.29933  ORF Transcript_13979/g.29933 Transcript_13979/m.29933 type:complete len:201 (-) Transcript_13979:4461-5063(-)